MVTKTIHCPCCGTHFEVPVPKSQDITFANCYVTVCPKCESLSIQASPYLFQRFEAQA